MSRLIKPQLFSASELGLDRHLFAPEVYRVTTTLNKAGLKAFIVGGNIRDRLLEQQPTDYDMVTDATSSKLKQLFPRARVVGRRFPIVHLRMPPNNMLIEMTSFGGNVKRSTRRHKGSTTKAPRVKYSSKGNSGSSNFYADPWRRDFTVNALYFDVRQQHLYDFFNSVADIKERVLRVIGDAEQSYREDPVRVLRAIRLCGKFGFHLVPDQEPALRDNARYLRSCNPRRLNYECSKTFGRGDASANFELLIRFGVIKTLFPALTSLVNENNYLTSFFYHAMAETDAAMKKGYRHNMFYTYSCLFWPLLCQLSKWNNPHKPPPSKQIIKCFQNIWRSEMQYVSLPPRELKHILDIWLLQSKLAVINQEKTMYQLAQARQGFTFGLKLLELRCLAGAPLHKQVALAKSVRAMVKRDKRRR